MTGRKREKRDMEVKGIDHSAVTFFILLGEKIHQGFKVMIKEKKKKKNFKKQEQGPKNC